MSTFSINKPMPVPKKLPKKSKAIEKADRGPEKYFLQLFVAGILPNSARAIENAKLICEKHLSGRYELEIIDIYQQPAYAVQAEIVAVPLLIKKRPLPEERMIGDLSDSKEVLRGLRIRDLT